MNGGNLEKQLKGLDMMVSQTLKSLTSNVRVTAVVGDSNYHEDVGSQKSDENFDQNSEDGSVRPSATISFIGAMLVI